MSLRFDPEGGVIIVPALLRGPAGRVAARLVLDTGAAGTTVSVRVVEMLGYELADAEEQVQLTTASGVEVAPRIRIAGIKALGKRRRGLLVVCHTLPPRAKVDGVIGLDFLRGYRLVVDFRAGLVDLD